jgi:vacuolar protein sorting-associated protein 72
LFRQEPPAKLAKTKSPDKAKPRPPRPKADKASRNWSSEDRSFTVLDSGRISLRKSTAAKSAETMTRLKERDEAERKKPKITKVEEYIPTQEELLEEVKETEKENLKDLERFRRLELEKKKTRPTKRVFTGPMIRYHSMSMPLIEEMDDKVKFEKFDELTAPLDEEKM